jgi:hypothetical protein
MARFCRRWAETHLYREKSAQRPELHASGSFLVGATIVDIDPDSRLRLMEWCYVVCSHERLRGHRLFALPLPEAEAIVDLPRPLPRKQRAGPPEHPRPEPGLIALSRGA